MKFSLEPQQFSSWVHVLKCYFNPSPNEDDRTGLGTPVVEGIVMMYQLLLVLGRKESGRETVSYGKVFSEKAQSA